MPNGNNAGIRDEPDPGNLTDPPFNNNVFANGAGFPGGAPGSGKTLTQAVLNGTNAIPVNGNYPPIPAVSGARVGGGTRPRRLPHPHVDEPGCPVRRDAVRLAERRLHRRRGELHAVRAGASGPSDADGTDFTIAKNVAEESATLLKNSDHALPLAAATSPAMASL